MAETGFRQCFSWLANALSNEGVSAWQATLAHISSFPSLETGKYGCTKVRVYSAECSEQLGRDPSKNGSSKSLVSKSFFCGGNTLGLVPSSHPHSLGYACTLYAPTSPLPTSSCARQDSGSAPFWVLPKYSGRGSFGRTKLALSKTGGFLSEAESVGVGAFSPLPKHQTQLPRAYLPFLASYARDPRRVNSVRKFATEVAKCYSEAQRTPPY